MINFISKHQNHIEWLDGGSIYGYQKEAQMVINEISNHPHKKLVIHTTTKSELLSSEKSVYWVKSNLLPTFQACGLRKIYWVIPTNPLYSIWVDSYLNDEMIIKLPSIELTRKLLLEP